MSRLHAVLAAALVATAPLFGPPHITIKPATAPADVAAGVVFDITAEHHDRPELLGVYGRAEGLRNGKRVSLPLAFTRHGDARFTVKRQWDAGTPWVLLFWAQQGHGTSRGVAEVVVSVDAAGKVLRTAYVKPAFLTTASDPSAEAAQKLEAELKMMGINGK
jgi:hypothetical protein